jgi:hypothetical protein
VYRLDYYPSEGADVHVHAYYGSELDAVADALVAMRSGACHRIQIVECAENPGEGESMQVEFRFGQNVALHLAPQNEGERALLRMFREGSVSIGITPSPNPDHVVILAEKGTVSNEEPNEGRL